MDSSDFEGQKVLRYFWCQISADESIDFKITYYDSFLGKSQLQKLNLQANSR